MRLTLCEALTHETCVGSLTSPLRRRSLRFINLIREDFIVKQFADIVTKVAHSPQLF